MVATERLRGLDNRGRGPITRRLSGLGVKLRLLHLRGRARYDVQQVVAIGTQRCIQPIAQILERHGLGRRPGIG